MGPVKKARSRWIKPMGVARILARREQQRLDDVLRAAGAAERRLDDLDRLDRADTAEMQRQFALADEHGLRQMPAYLAGLRARQAMRLAERRLLQADLVRLRDQARLHHRETEKFEIVDAASVEALRQVRVAKDRAASAELAAAGFIRRRREAEHS
jgi:hypothetical protein